MTESIDGAGVIQLLFHRDTEGPVDPALVKMLTLMGEAWGPLGVARVAAHLVWPDLVVREIIITIDKETTSE